MSSIKAGESRPIANIHRSTEGERREPATQAGAPVEAASLPLIPQPGHKDKIFVGITVIHSAASVVVRGLQTRRDKAKAVNIADFESFPVEEGR